MCMSKILTHLPHFEDAILSFNRASIAKVGQLASAIVGCNPRLSIRHKIDGLPAIILGSSPYINDGRFFVKTKWANCPPISTQSDIPADMPTEKAYKLRSLINAIQDSPLVGLYQADLLYLPHTLKNTNDGLYFQPNVISYSVSYSDTDYQLIKSKSVGLCVHSVYNTYAGDLVYKPFDEPNHGNIVDGIPSAYIMDNKWSGEACVSEREYVESLLEEWRTMARVVGDKIGDRPSDEMVALLCTYANRVYRGYGEFGYLAADFVEYINERIAKEQASRKTETGRNNVHARYSDIISFCQQNHRELNRIFMLYSFTLHLKQALLNYVGPMRGVSQEIDGAYTELGEGLVVTDPFLGCSVKLVPRNSFSRANFARNG